MTLICIWRGKKTAIPRNSVFAFAALSCISLFMSPITWWHHYTLIVPPAIAMIVFLAYETTAARSRCIMGRGDRRPVPHKLPSYSSYDRLWGRLVRRRPAARLRHDLAGCVWGDVDAVHLADRRLRVSHYFGFLVTWKSRSSPKLAYSSPMSPGSASCPSSIPIPGMPPFLNQDIIISLTFLR